MRKNHPPRTEAEIYNYLAARNGEPAQPKNMPLRIDPRMPEIYARIAAERAIPSIG